MDKGDLRSSPPSFENLRRLGPGVGGFFRVLAVAKDMTEKKMTINEVRAADLLFHRGRLGARSTLENVLHQQAQFYPQRGPTELQPRKEFAL